MRTHLILFAHVLLGLFVTHLAGQDAGNPPADTLGEVNAKPPYSPYARSVSPNRVFWGDTHLHTSFSMDAGAFGNRLGPEEAYRFARGEVVTATTGGRTRLARPLDFLGRFGNYITVKISIQLFAK